MKRRHFIIQSSLAGISLSVLPSMVYSSANTQSLFPEITSGLPQIRHGILELPHVQQLNGIEVGTRLLNAMRNVFVAEPQDQSPLTLLSCLLKRGSSDELISNLQVSHVNGKINWLLDEEDGTFDLGKDVNEFYSDESLRLQIVSTSSNRTLHLINVNSNTTILPFDESDSPSDIDVKGQRASFRKEKGAWLIISEPQLQVLLD